MVNKEAKIQKLEARVYSQEQKLDSAIKILLDLTKLSQRLNQDFLETSCEIDNDLEQMKLKNAKKFAELFYLIEQINLKLVKLVYDKGISA
jgi:hypothetical protein